jgi:hypothetical protein
MVLSGYGIALARALDLNAFPVPLINLMSHSDGNPANNTPKKESARLLLQSTSFKHSKK